MCGYGVNVTVRGSESLACRIEGGEVSPFLPMTRLRCRRHSLDRTDTA